MWGLTVEQPGDGWLGVKAIPGESVVLRWKVAGLRGRCNGAKAVYPKLRMQVYATWSNTNEVQRQLEYPGKCGSE